MNQPKEKNPTKHTNMDCKQYQTTNGSLTKSKEKKSQKQLRVDKNTLKYIICSKSSSKFIVIKVYHRKLERSQINDLIFHQKDQKKKKNKKKSNININGKKEIRKIRAEIKQRLKNVIEETNENKSWSLGKINKIDKTSARYIKEKKGSNQ